MFRVRLWSAAWATMASMEHRRRNPDEEGAEDDLFRLSQRIAGGDVAAARRAYHLLGGDTGGPVVSPQVAWSWVSAGLRLQSYASRGRDPNRGVLDPCEPRRLFTFRMKDADYKTNWSELAMHCRGAGKEIVSLTAHAAYLDEAPEAASTLVYGLGDRRQRPRRLGQLSIMAAALADDGSCVIVEGVGTEVVSPLMEREISSWLAG